MIGFDSPIPVWAVLLWLAAGIAVLARGAALQRRVTTPGYLALLSSLRALALVLTALVLLNPYVIRRQADPERFKVLILGDASASMSTRDLPGGEARLQLVRRVLMDPAGLRSRLSKRWQTDSRIFAETQYPFTGEDFSQLPGRTALGAVLEDVADPPDAVPVGAIVLLTDGNSNQGVRPTDAARVLGSRGIPVNAVGVGREAALLDVAVQFEKHNLEVEPGEQVPLAVTLGSNLPDTEDVEVRLEEGGTVVARQRMAVGGDQPAAATQFTVQPYGRGNHVYRVVIEAPAADRRPETDVDYATVEVKKPDRFRVLYMSAHLGWQYPFLQRLADEHRQMEMAAVIRTGERTFLQKGKLPEAVPADAFPETLDVFAQFDVVVADTRVFAELPSETVATLRRFVDRRGGGLLAVGPGEAIPEAVKAILPATASLPLRAPARSYMDVESADVLQTEAGSPLTVPPGPWIPEGARLVALRGQKPAARAVLLLSGEGAARPILTAQFYGSGRSGWLGLHTDWRWALSDSGDRARYRAFWANLVGWLGSGTEPRLNMSSHGMKTPVGEAAKLAVDVRSRDYEPATSAEVRFSVAGPGQETQLLEAAPSTERPGRFAASFTPREKGEYRFALRVEFPDGETMTRTGYFLAVPTGDELANVRYRPDVLRDVARLSGGRLFPSADAIDADNLVLSPTLPTVEVRHELIHQWWWLALLLAILVAEWYARRRIGLR